MFKFTQGILLMFFLLFLITSCGISDSCKTGKLQTQECGEDNKGTQNRVCINGDWGGWTECFTPVECSVNGTTIEQTCGINDSGKQIITCIENKWSEPTECIIPSNCEENKIEEQACGENNTGKQNRTCTNNTWSDWSDCVIPTTCEENKVEEQVCGENNTGKQNRTCTNNTWSDWSDCVIPTICEENKTEEQACGENNAGKQNRTCTSNTWSDWSECVLETTGCTNNQIQEGEICGVNGVLVKVCNNETWSEELCHEIDGEFRTFTVYIKTENDAITSYLMDAAQSAWNYFSSVHLGLREQTGGEVGYHPALRFENIQIPLNTELVETTLSFYPNSNVENDKVRINIYGEKVLNSEEFDTANYLSNRPDQRLRTTVKVPENTNNPESWRIECVSDCCKDEPDCNRLWRYDCPQRKLDCWSTDTKYNVPHDLSPIIEEITSIENWNVGNTITLFLESALNLNDGDSIGTRSINDFDERGIEYNPSLTIKYKFVD